MYGALFFTMALLLTTAYFLMGGLPLLVLKHDVPMDAWFVRSFFNFYFRSSFWMSVGACISYAVWERYPFAIGAALFAGITTLVRRQLVQAMARLGEKIEASDASAIRNFRRVHSAALAINGIQLAMVVWGVLLLSQELTPR